MNRTSQALGPVGDPTLRAQVGRRILEMVTGGHYLPGEKLVETVLADQLQVSRAPLREAIRELTDQGILINRPYRDLRVRPVSAKDLEELYSLRTALEQFAFRLAWPQRSTEALRDLEERHNALIESHETNDDPTATNERELAFHSWVYESTGHTLLLSHWRRLVPLVQIYMSLHYRTHGAHGEFRHMTTEYLRLAGGDSLDAMCEHIHAHMKQGLASVMAALPER